MEERLYAIIEFYTSFRNAPSIEMVRPLVPPEAACGRPGVFVKAPIAGHSI